MNRRYTILHPWALLAVVVVGGGLTWAQDQTQSPDSAAGQKPDSFQINLPKQEEKKPVVLPNTKLTNQGRMTIIRGMTAELGFARKPFPFGKSGLTLKDGKLTNPTEEQLQQMMTMYGPAVKPGERARITDVKFKDKSIIFEINGGPQRKKKWYEHVQVSGMGGTVQPGQPTDETNIHGSFVELAFDKFVPEVTPDQLKQLLDPVINFSAKSASEAYLDTVPPKAKQAIADHKVLVGMNREMVTYAKGRPPQKYRDKDGDTDYEEWIYGAPPQEVEFIRFVGDEVVRVETMKVDGTKVVRTDREVVLQPEHPEVAQQQQQQQPTPAPNPQNPPAQTTQSQGTPQPGGGTDQGPTGRPSLRRPGEEVGQQTDGTRPQDPGQNVPDVQRNPPQPN
jgi:hypothetical protein